MATAISSCIALFLRGGSGKDAPRRPRVVEPNRGPAIAPTLTAEAYAHGLALALPEEVSVPAMPARGRPRKNMALARPTGLGRALTAYDMPIEGRDEWVAAARRLA